MNGDDGPAHSDSLPDLIPVRKLNEYVYCPRLSYLEWVQSEWRDNVETVDGKVKHRRVDRETGDLPSPGEDEEAEVRSIMLSAPELGLISKLDLVETSEGESVPVDYKRGKKPKEPPHVYPADRVQVVAQGLILRENGHQVDHGVIVYLGSRDRVEVPLSDEAIGEVEEAMAGMREMAATGRLPDPLVDSPKCPRCSLVTICLPDEINYLLDEDRHPRRLVPRRDDGLPVYVQTPGAWVRKKGGRLRIERKGEELGEARVADTTQLAVFGAVQITSAAFRSLLSAGIPICHFSSGGYFYGISHGMSHKNVELRRLQYRSADDEEFCLALARDLVSTKIQNQRTLLRRNHGGSPDQVLSRLKEWSSAAEEAGATEVLLGLEGAAGRDYFSAFDGMLKAPEHSEVFQVDGRNRRPPTDPINALLSFGYSLLTRDWNVTLLSVGFDPYLGFFHSPKYGRPALSLDMMEPFRPLVVDSVVLNVINNGMLGPNDFRRVGTSCSLRRKGRKTFIEAYERRLDELVTHPVFDYRISYRRVFEVQARLLGRFLEGGLEGLPAFVTR